jgi:hypothetical protein
MQIIAPKANSFPVLKRRTDMERPTKTRLGFLRNFQKPPFCTKTHWVKAKVLTMNLYGFSGEEGQILKQALI